MQKRLCGREQEFGMVVIDPEADEKKNSSSPEGPGVQVTIGGRESEARADYPAPSVFGPSHPHGPFCGGYGPTYMYPENIWVVRILQEIQRFGRGRTQGDSKVWLRNGSLAYIDQEKLEVSSPECLAGSLDLVAQERASERILNKALHRIERTSGVRISLYKNNADSSPAVARQNSYGSHHNYSYRPSDMIKVRELMRNFIPAFLPITGNGQILLLKNGRAVYCFSQRSLHVRKISSNLSTDQAKPLINPKNYSNDLLTRLHLIGRDATRCEFQTWLVDGITHLVLRLAEEGWRLPPKKRLYHPIKQLHRLNLSLDLSYQLQIVGGRIDPLAFQMIFWEAAKQLRPLSDLERKCLSEWKRILEILRAGDFRKLVGELDWATKKFLLESKMKQKGFDLKDGRALKINFNYHNISDLPERSWFVRLDEAGLIRHLVSEKEIQQAMLTPPKTRAYSRGLLIVLCRRYPSLNRRIANVSWESASFLTKDGGTSEIFFGDPPDDFSISSSSLDKVLRRLRIKKPRF